MCRYQAMRFIFDVLLEETILYCTKDKFVERKTRTRIRMLTMTVQ